MIRTIKRAAVIWGVAALLLLFWSVAAGISNSSAKDNYHGKQKHALVMARFWHVLAGDTNGGEGVADKLARDLRDTRSGDLIRFRGDSNKYGGISGELGFDPFNGENCSECGPLDDDVLAKAREVKAGKITQVIAREQTAAPRHHSGAPGWLWALWLLSYPLFSIATFWGFNKARQRRYRDMPSEMELVHKLDRALGGTFDSPQERYELEQTRNKLMAEIETRVSYRTRAVQRMKINNLSQEARDALDAIEQGNQTLPNR